MKKIFFLLLPALLIGCVTIKMPETIQEDFAYKKVFKADFEKSIKAAAASLEDLGWKVADISRSKLIKQDRTLDKSTIYLAYILTEIKQTQLFLTSAYSTFNVRVEPIDDAQTEIAIRYLSVMPIPPFYNKKISYKNDKLVDKIYSDIEKYLSK
jgi:transketolase